MIDGFTLGAYAAEPRRPALEGESERRWFRALAEIEGARGLEVFFRGTIHPHGPEHLAALLPDGWHAVITALPQTVSSVAADPHYGLASRDDDGRRSAIADIRALLVEAHRLDGLLGRRVVRAVQLHSAPQATGPATSSADALARSLTELRDIAEGTPLIVEHCDALIPGRRAVKGFLGLDEERAAVRLAGSEGHSVNWGRSAIEGRSDKTPVAHIAQLAADGALAGLMFSGAPEADGALGAAWDDLHNPLRVDDPSSMLDEAGVRDALAALDHAAWDRLLFLGAKVQDPADSADIERRLAPLATTIGAIRAGMEKR